MTYYAMQHAACHGAALVAAAGNDPIGSARDPKCPQVAGATCPGAMSNIPAPTPAQCDALYEAGSGYESRHYKIYDPFSDPNDMLDHPLVHTISAVDAAGKLLPITRAGTLGKLAAMGELGTAQAILDAMYGQYAISQPRAWIHSLPRLRIFAGKSPERRE